MKLVIPKLRYKGSVKGAPGARKPCLGHKAKENDIIKMRWR